MVIQIAGQPPESYRRGPSVILSERTPVSLELRALGHPAPDCAQASPPAWLADVREMRGQVWFDGGRRPSFQKTNGSFEDADAIDLLALHVVAQAQGRVVGCARVVPLARIESGMVSSAIGPKRLTRILRDLGTTRDAACEASRWVVVPEFRGELGPRIVAASGAVARWLSMEVGFVMAGTRQKQDMALIRLGARPVKDVPMVRSELFDDELRLLYFDVRRLHASMRRQMDAAESALDLIGRKSLRAIYLAAWV